MKHVISREIVLALIGVIVGLLLVGVVSHTPIRHCVQVVPAVVALLLAIVRSPLARSASAPIFLFWFLIMSLIWLYLLGVARIITGNFSPAEIAFTILIGLSCVLGLVASYRSRSSAVNWIASLFVFAVFAALQVLFLWLSLRPGISTQ